MGNDKAIRGRSSGARFPLAAAVLAALIVAGCASAPRPLDPDLRATAERLYQSEDYQAAADAYRRLLAAGPGEAGDWFRLGNAEAGSGRLVEAAEAYRHALALAPDHAEARHNLGLVYMELAVRALLKSRADLPPVDQQSAETMRYLACVMETFMGRPEPVTCRFNTGQPAP